MIIDDTLQQAVIQDLHRLFEGESTGHDVEHSLRVLKTALEIAEGESCNRQVVMLASLLHDADDHKLFHTENYANARSIMNSHGVPSEVQEQVIAAIDGVSFSKNKGRRPATIEGCIVQDADRLDAMGAVGIARTFAYGGKMGRNLATSLQHFDEKLFLLKNLMNTETGMRLAEKRDRILHEFYDAFLDECTAESGGGQMSSKEQAVFHLPGLFEFYDLYRMFLPLWKNHRDWFYDWGEIGSIYGAPADALWGGGRAGFGRNDIADEVLALCREYGISARLTFSNSLLTEEHLSDRQCNRLCELFASVPGNGVIVHSDLLASYIRQHYPSLYLVSSTTKVITDFQTFTAELNRPEFSCVVPDFRLNPRLSDFAGLNLEQKQKVEFLCNECCWFDCYQRKACYEHVSALALGNDCGEWKCCSPDRDGGYVFSKAMENPGFISREAVRERYLASGFTNFKIEGRSLGSALILEFLLYYLTKPEFQLQVREAIYLDNSLDLF